MSLPRLSVKGFRQSNELVVLADQDSPSEDRSADQGVVLSPSPIEIKKAKSDTYIHDPINEEDGPINPIKDDNQQPLLGVNAPEGGEYGAVCKQKAILDKKDKEDKERTKYEVSHYYNSLMLVPLQTILILSDVCTRDQLSVHVIIATPTQPKVSGCGLRMRIRCVAEKTA